MTKTKVKVLKHCCNDCLMYDKECVLPNLPTKGEVYRTKSHKTYSRHPSEINTCPDWQN